MSEIFGGDRSVIFARERLAVLRGFYSAVSGSEVLDEDLNFKQGIESFKKRIFL